MSDYWGVPEEEYELSLLQFAREELNKIGCSVLSEKVEVCSGAGAMTLTAVLKTENSKFGLYIHDGPKQRKSRGPPVIKVLSLLPGMKYAEELRNFVLSHYDFYTLLSPQDKNLKNMREAEIRKIYTILYNSKIKDLYVNDLSSAADVLRVRLRKDENHEPHE